MENNNEEEIENKKEIKIKLITIIIIGIIIALVIIGIVVFANIFQSSKTGTTSKPSNSKGTSSDGSHNDILVDFKPIIYLYPEKSTEISVKLGKPENITCSYPKYNKGWHVIANPDGTLFDVNTGRKLYSLYWEGLHSEPYNFDEGFVVRGNKTIEFLEEKLAILGLTEIEAEEFIVYWLPKLQDNEYNYIKFATMNEINNNMPLEFSVEPDTIIRVLMQFKGLKNSIDVQEQKLETPERTGFVAVEWGGMEIK